MSQKQLDQLILETTRPQSGRSLKRLLNEFKSYEELQGRIGQAETDVEAGAQEATEEVKSSLGEMISGWFETIGFVDPCDLVKKHRGKLEGELATLEAMQDELNRMRAQDINDRLTTVSGLVGGLGVGSLGYYFYQYW